MINKNEILEFARTYSLDANVVEKDYVIGWVLGGISRHPELADPWIFKGGTCLKKCFFETYRFSEDLDFTLLKPDHLNADFLVEVFSAVAQWVYDQSGIEIPKERLRFDIYKNTRGKPAGEGRIYYRGPMGRQGNPARIKLDLTADEIVVAKPEPRDIFHPYSDKPQESLTALCYSLPELFGEKIRALSERLSPRDLYDVVFLSRLDGLEIDYGLLRDVLEKKCAFKGIAIPTFASLQDNPSRIELEAEWGNMLSNQLPLLPAFREYLEALPRVFEMISGIPKEAPRAAIPFDQRIDPSWIAPRGLGYTSAIGGLETIRFAASNRLCVKLAYGGTQRLIEPYSLRKTKQGDILLFGVKHQTGEIRAYRLDRIEGAEATNISFMPRFAVELTSLGPTPLISRSKMPRETLYARPKRTSRGTPRRTSIIGPHYHGPRYIFRCPICQKKFVKKTNDSKLNPHKGQYRVPCPGRTGHLEKVISP